MITWNVTPEDGTSAEELRTRKKFKSIRMFTGLKAVMVWSSRENGRECLV